MKLKLIFFYLFPILAGIFMNQGCGVSFYNSTASLKTIPAQTNCDQFLTSNDFDDLLKRVEDENDYIAYNDAELNNLKAESNIILDKNILKRLTDDAIYFIGFSEQLGKNRKTILNVQRAIVEDGFQTSPCQLNEDQSINIDFVAPARKLSNFPDLLKSYNDSAKNLNNHYVEMLTKFQIDFRGTKIRIKSNKVSGEIKRYELPDKLNRIYLKHLYESRLKPLIIISRGKK